MRIIITTWDSSSHILRNFAYMAEKYIPEWEVEILGYTIFPNLPRKYKRISVGEVQRSWALDYHSYVRTIPEDFVIFGTDDLLITRPVDYEVFNEVMKNIHDDKSIGRYELGTGHVWHKERPIIRTYTDWDIYEYGVESEYRISTQLSVWRTAYLLKYLSYNWTAWEFELNGSVMAKHDGKRIIATNGRHAFGWTHCLSTKRYNGFVNVSGIDDSDVEEMISLGFLERGNLILGENIENKKYP